MKRFILGSLHYSRRERLGTFALMLLCAVIFTLPEIIRYYSPGKTTDFSQFQSDIRAFRTGMEVNGTQAGTTPGELFLFDPNTASFDDFVRLGISGKVANTIGNYREKGGIFRKPEDFQKIWSLPMEDYERLSPYIRIGLVENEEVIEAKHVSKQYELFVFDPNAATENEFLRLGLPPWTIRSILNYRAKGGAFRNKEDFRKIYTLRDEDYTRLEPYIVFAQITASAASSQPASFSGNNAPQKRITKEAIDINQASEEDWQLLPGIGEKRAQQIIHFRTSLGGFISVEQVGEMYGLPDSVFQKIRPMLVLQHTDVRKINLNTATIEDLDKHPYISPKQAKLVVAYREQHGAFAAVDDLTKIAAFTDKKWLEKVKPYLEVN